ncbi:MFS transporter [Litorihabitans aurantiacus]|nr:MFS transporter [Litorihabitans aurantiacus]
MGQSDGAAREPLRRRPFRLFWLSTTAGSAALAIGAVAVDVLVIDVLSASEFEVGLVRAAQLVPYLLVGLVAGAYVDRWRRRPVLLSTHLAQAGLLLAIPLLHVLGLLTLPAAVAVLFLAGCCAVFTAAAEQSWVPDLVPRTELVAANARVAQSMTVTQSLAPAAAGGLTSLLGAPVALAAVSLTRLGGALAVARMPRTAEAEEVPAAEREPVLRAVARGVRFTYGHRVLGPLAVSTHVWFVANAVAVVVLGLLVLRTLALPAAAYGLILTAAGVGGVAGALLATRLARLLGEGRVVVVSRLVCALGWAAVAFAPVTAPTALLVTYLALCQAVIGVSMGAEEPSEMGLRHDVTPRAMLGRVSATYRSANRTAAVVGALAGGALATALPLRTTLLVVAAVFLAAVAVAACSGVRTARIADDAG